MVITVAIVVAGTLLTRFGAFLVFPSGKKAPDFVLYLGKALPAAVMGMLVVYTFKETVVLAYPYGIPELIALLVTVGLHLWKRNMLVSIAVGTIVYMLIVQNIRQTTLALRSPKGEVRPGRWRLDEGDISFMYVARDKNARIHKL